MKYEISDCQPDGVSVTFPECFIFDTPEEAHRFAKKVKDWYNEEIRKNKERMFGIADKTVKED